MLGILNLRLISLRILDHIFRIFWLIFPKYVSWHSRFYFNIIYLEMTNNIINQIGSLLIIHNLSKEGSWLCKVIVWVSWLIPSNQSCDSKLTSLWFRNNCERLKWIGFIIRSISLIIEWLWSISLLINYSSSIWAINWDLSVISSQSMSMSIWIRE